jgi:4-methyl-5(b-hydroxyethyl)-thiazole monophosphate biosynthesis
MRALVLLADGFEELEAVTIVDVLRRGGVSVTTASLAGSAVQGSHGISIVADRTFDDEDVAEYDAVVLPGGMPGAARLRDSAPVREALQRAAGAGKIVAAICAGPIALEAAGLLERRRATSYPGHALPSARYQEERVVVDDRIVTSRGPGTAIEFALTLVGLLEGSEARDKVARALLV